MTIQNAWNAPYLSTKGDTFAGTGARPTVLPVGTNGQVLTADSAQTGGVKWATNAATPSFNTIVVQVFSTHGAGTYTPTANMSYCIVECVGGGGGGGNAATSGAAAGAAGSGGGSGGYCRKVFDATTIGVSQPFVVGTGGAATTAGTATTFGTGPILSAGGGTDGIDDGSSSGTGSRGGDGGIATGGDINCTGNSGGPSMFLQGSLAGLAIGGYGAPSVFGGGVTSSPSTGGSNNGSNGTAYGAGASGGVTANSTASVGGAAVDGVIIVTEFIV